MIIIQDLADFLLDLVADPVTRSGLLHVGQAERVAARLGGGVPADVGQGLGDVPVLFGVPLGDVTQEGRLALLVEGPGVVTQVFGQGLVDEEVAESGFEGHPWLPDVTGCKNWFLNQAPGFPGPDEGRVTCPSSCSW